MAILSKIRSKGIFLIIIIALALFAFIVGDLLRQGSLTGGGADTIGVIGDNEIKRESFARQIQNFMQNRQGMTEAQAAEALWNQEIRNTILNAQVDAAGIQVSDEAVSNYIKTSYAQVPQFQDDNGNFSESKLYAFIEDLKTNDPARYQLWQQDVENAANAVKQQQFFTLLKSGLVGTNASGEQEYRLENDNRNFSYVNIPYSSIPDDKASVSKDEIKKYIEDRPDQYQTVAQRDISFVLFEDKASNSDKDALKSSVEKLMNDTKVFNKNTNNDELRVGLKNSTDPTRFANENSDIAGNTNYVPVSSLSDGAQGLNDTEVGAVYGPYEDAGYYKASRVLDRKVVMDSIKNRHILVAYAGAERANPTITRNKEEAKKVADSLLGVIGQNKATFDTQFTYFTENTDLAKGEDIGWVVNSGNASGFAPGFTKFLFDNTQGTVGIAESSFGYHIIRIDEAKAPTNSLKLATVAKKIEASKATGKQLFNTVQKFEAAVEKGKFDEVAKKYEVTPTPVTSLKSLDETLPGLGQNRAIVKWAFDEETSLNDTKRFEVSNGYVVAKVTKVSEEGLMSVEEASVTVTPILRNQKKAKMIMDKIKSKDLQAIASANNVSVQEAAAVNCKNPTIAGAGNEPRVVGTAFGLKLNKTSKPVAGETGVFVVKTTAIQNAPDIKNYQGTANELASRIANQSTSLLIEALKKKMDIKDNRSKFY
jgi:peptidylprolyl isomerase/peptidyl-prolyl cis-trans isomerase D